MALCGFAVAQPLFEILSRHAQFIVARHSKPVDIVVFALGVAVVLPALGWIIVVCGRLLHPRVGLTFYSLLSTLLFGCVLLSFAKLTFAAKSVYWVVLALSLGAGFSVLFFRVAILRTSLALASVAPLAFMALFLLRPPISSLVFVASGPVAGDSRSVQSLTLYKNTASRRELSNVGTLSASDVPSCC